MDEEKPAKKTKFTKIQITKTNMEIVPAANNQSYKKTSDLGPPDWLSEDQKSLWESAVKFSPPNQLQPIDASALNIWVIASDFLRQASVQLSSEPLVITSPRTQRQVPNPLVGVIAKQSAILLRAAAELGFTPSSRSRLRCGADDQSGVDWEDF